MLNSGRRSTKIVTAVRSQSCTRVEVSLVSDTQRITVAALIAELRAGGFNFVNDDWLQNLCDDPSLISKSRSEGRLGHTHSIREVERIRQIARIVQDIGPGWDKAELAFCMAASGMKHAPPSLVANHIRSGIDSFFGYLKRIAERSVSGRRLRLRESLSREEAMARRVSRLMFGDFGIPKTPQFEVQRQQLESILTVALGVLYFENPLDNYLRRIRDICHSLQPESGDRLFATVHDWLQRHPESLTLDSEGSGLKRVVNKALRVDPRFVVQGARDAVHALRLLKRSFGNITAVPLEPKKTLELILFRVMRGLPCVIAAMNVERLLKNPADEFLIRLRQGDDFGLPRQIAELADSTAQEFAAQMESELNGT